MTNLNFDALSTPALLLNKDILEKNCRKMQDRIGSFGLSLRPHMKTAKSIDVYHFATYAGFKGITVSTLAEASYFARQGITDIIYAVGIVPAKLSKVSQIQSLGADVKVITDNISLIPKLNQAAAELNLQLNVLIEIDSGGARGGILPDSLELLELGSAIAQATNLNFTGVLTHAGHSYHCRSIKEIQVIAETERVSVIKASSRLKSELNLDCTIISTGSTPTATYAASFEGLTETRPGVYMFGDIDQYFIGSCEIKDIAVSVLTTVIGHNKHANRILIDAGGLALSKDISATEFSKNTGYGLLCDQSGQYIEGLYVESVHQEHGLIASVPNSLIDYDKFPVGSLLRILPIHACMTVAAYENYYVHDDQNEVTEKWSRINRW